MIGNSGAVLGWGREGAAAKGAAPSFRNRHGSIRQLWLPINVT